VGVSEKPKKMKKKKNEIMKKEAAVS